MQELTTDNQFHDAAPPGTSRIRRYLVALVVLFAAQGPTAHATPATWEAESLKFTSQRGSFNCSGCHVATQVNTLTMEAPASVPFDATSASVSLSGFQNGNLLSSWRYQIQDDDDAPLRYGIRPSDGQSSSTQQISFDESDSPVVVRYCLVDANDNTRRWNCGSRTLLRDAPPNDPPEITSANPGTQTLRLPDDTFAFTPTASDDVAVVSLTVKSSNTSVVEVDAGSGGSYTLTPVSSGSSTITVRALDAADAEATQTFMVTVLNRIIIDPPVIVPPIIVPPVIVPPINIRPVISLDGTFSGALVLQVGGIFTVEFTAEDSDGDGLAFDVSSSNAGVATGQYSPPGSLIVDAHAAGSAVITLTVTDLLGLSASLDINVTVERGNSAPEAVADTVIASATEQSLLLNVLSNDSDPDGDSLTIVLDSDRSSLGVPLSVSGSSVRYQAESVLTAMDSFSYRAQDNEGARSSSVVVTLQPSDEDGDGAIDVFDNCPVLPNPLQADMDSDGLGDLCDADPDGDGEPGISGEPMESGQSLVENECLTCHLTGTGGAPLFEDDAVWAARIAAAGGEPDDMLDSVLNGLGGMPAFGSRYPTQDLLEAIYYLSGSEETGEEPPGEIVDPDLDNVDSAVDNCPRVPNPAQTDSDSNGVGDACEPLADRDQDGYPYALDDDDNNANRLPASLPVSTNATVATSEAGLRLGRLALADAQSAGYARAGMILSFENFTRAAAQVFPGVSVTREERFRSLMGVINIDVAASSGEAALILALGANLPLNPVVQVFDPVGGQWQSFTSGAMDQLASAPAGSTDCPAITSANYQNGLSPALSCLRVKVQDGGNNDADGSVNGRVELIVDIASETQDDVNPGPAPVDTNPSKGGGTAGPAFLVFMLMSAFIRRSRFQMRNRA